MGQDQANPAINTTKSISHTHDPEKKTEPLHAPHTFQGLMPSMQYAGIMYDTSLAAFLTSVGGMLNEGEEAWQEGW